MSDGTTGRGRRDESKSSGRRANRNKRTVEMIGRAIALIDEGEAVVRRLPTGEAALAECGSNKSSHKSKLDRWSVLSQVSSRPDVAAELGPALPQVRARLEEASGLYWGVVVANDRLAREFAGNRVSDVPFDDVLSVVLLGMYEAAKRFRPEYGFTFSTYSRWWMRSGVFRELFWSGEASGSLRVPAWRYHEIRQVRKWLDSGMSLTETAQQMGLTVEQVRKTLVSAKKVVSLDQPSSGDPESRSMYEVLSREDDGEELFSSADVEMLYGHLDGLDVRYRKVLSMRYGLHGSEPMTLAEVGLKMRLSRERVRQIESEALTELKSAIKTHGKTGLNTKKSRVGSMTHYDRKSEFLRMKLKSGLLQHQLAAILAPRLKRSLKSVAASLSRLENHGRATDELFTAVREAIEEEIQNPSLREVTSVDAERSRFRSISRKRRRPHEPPAPSAGPPPADPGRVPAGLGTEMDQAPDVEPRSSQALRGVTVGEYLDPVEAGSRAQVIPSPQQREQAGEVPIEHDQWIEQLGAALTRVGVPQAPRGEDVGWRAGWVERLVNPSGLHREPNPDEDRANAILTRLGVPSAQAGDTSWRIGWLEGRLWSRLEL